MLLFNDKDLTEDQREQTPYEEYDDVVAYDVDGEFFGFKLGTNKLEDISLLFISEEIGAEPFDLTLSYGKQKIDFDEYSSTVDLLCQISGLFKLREVIEDHSAGSVTDIVLIEDVAKADKVSRDIEILARALVELQGKAEKASAT